MSPAENKEDLEQRQWHDYAQLNPVLISSQ